MAWQPVIQARIARDGTCHRRQWFRLLGGAAAAGSVLGWCDFLSLHAAELKKRNRQCILLWMQGGPSQFETWDPKPGHRNGGPTRAISTRVPGVKIAEHFPQLARQMHRLAVIRSVTSREGSHPRATSLMHTGYLPTPTVKYPSLGAVVAEQLPNPECELPPFVQVGRVGPNTVGSGFLGVDYSPFSVPQPGQMPENARITTSRARFLRRLELMDQLEEDFARQEAEALVRAHRKLYQKTARMILSEQMRAFDLSEEPASVRAAYGQGQFASGCLLARRLIEQGVPFVEVLLNGWDTHADNFQRTPALCRQVDRPFAALLEDLDSRGLLENTLVIWMGEFGRTPRINPRSGRDHYPRAFSVALAGAGIRGGAVVGRTDAGGLSVQDRPVEVADLFRTFCKALRIDADHEYMTPIGRPIKIVDGGQAVEELFG